MKNELGRQPDPTPPDIIPSAPPSIVLYAALFLFAAFLVFIAFLSSEPDWPGLFLNLATEIFGAVIILLLVERKLRASEMDAILSLPSNFKRGFAHYFVSDKKHLRGYAKSLLNSVSPLVKSEYSPRPIIDNMLNRVYTKPVLLVGGVGIGKSTTLQFLTYNKARNVVNDYKSSHIPIFIPLRKLHELNVLETLFYEIRSYYDFPKELFEKLLESGKLLCIFDGLDEIIENESALEKILNFHNRYPENQIIVSTRPNMVFNQRHFHVIQMPALDENQILEILGGRIMDIKKHSGKG